MMKAKYNLTNVFRMEEIETTALNGVSFEINNSEFVAVMGPFGLQQFHLAQHVRQ